MINFNNKTPQEIQDFKMLLRNKYTSDYQKEALKMKLNSLVVNGE